MNGIGGFLVILSAIYLLGFICWIVFFVLG